MAGPYRVKVTIYTGNGPERTVNAGEGSKAWATARARSIDKAVGYGGPNKHLNDKPPTVEIGTSVEGPNETKGVGWSKVPQGVAWRKIIARQDEGSATVRGMAAKKAATKGKSAKKPAARKPAARKAAAKKPAAKKAAPKRAAPKRAAPKRAPAKRAPAKAASKARRKLVGPFQVVLEARVNNGPVFAQLVSRHTKYGDAKVAATKHYNTIMRNQKKNPSVGRKARIVVADVGTNKNAAESSWHNGLPARPRRGLPASPDQRAGPW